MIDVIIPAYRGLPETRRCLESVLGADVAASHEVVVVDDASPEPALSEWLRGLAAAGRITLLGHERNAGFVASVNEGMRLHPDRDVLLLNSDTEVADGWLDRLAACAARAPDAGTVTPFSNNATICSYPRFAVPNALPAGESTAGLDARFARANAGRAVELPTAVGFCMYIRRACLDAVGAFDEAAFGRGYGEEVDFCLRASRAGWRHLLAADAFVFHAGEVSFGSGAAAVREKAQAIIDERYPEFRPRLAEFLGRDPARPLRRAADLARLRNQPSPLRVVRTGSGQAAAVDATGPAAGEAPTGTPVLALALPPGPGTSLSLAWLADGEEFSAFFDFPGDWDLLASLLDALRTSGDMPSLPSRIFYTPAVAVAPAGERADAAPEDGEILRAREQALQEALRQLRAIEESTSWRLTAPLRAAVERARSALQAVLRKSQGSGPK